MKGGEELKKSIYAKRFPGNFALLQGKIFQNRIVYMLF